MSPRLPPTGDGRYGQRWPMTVAAGRRQFWESLFGLSAVGGIAGKSGHSMWWGDLILACPIGWLMAVAGGVVGLVRHFKAKSQTAHA